MHPKTNHTRYTITHIKKLLTHSSMHVHTYSQVRISFLGSQQLRLHPEYVPRVSTPSTNMTRMCVYAQTDHTLILGANRDLYQFGSQSPLNIVFRDPKQGTRDTHEWIAWSRHTHPK